MICESTSGSLMPVYILKVIFFCNRSLIWNSFFTGDGMDRERRRDKTAPGKSNISGKGMQASPTKNAHLRHISGNTSTESGSGGNASGTGSNSLHPYHGTNDVGAPQNKIKFREQGVDELLQLKLHQAIAATDRVPDGSTIVLATGDGNMGQFNEEGFLGRPHALTSVKNLGAS